MTDTVDTQRPVSPSAAAPSPSGGADGQSMRLAEGGALIDRSQKLSFTLNGQALEGYRGDTLASALIANGRRFIGRSFKYHRPRGFMASGVEEPNGLFGVGEGDRFEPNQRGTMVELHQGLTATTQNHFPSLEYDVGSLNAMMSRMFPAGFYYKTFLKPRVAWKHVFEPFIRQAAGLGKAPKLSDPDSYEHFYYTCDVLVAGGGVSGIVAARAAAATGARVLLAEQGAHLGGRLLVDAGINGDGDGAQIERRPAAEWLAAEIAALQAMPNVVVRTRTQVSAAEDHNYALLYERLGDHLDPSARDTAAPRHRLWRVRAGRIITAAGAIERPIPFAHNDVPGVMLAAAVRDYLHLYGAKTGDRIVVYANNDDAYRTAIALRDAGVEVPVILDAREGSNGDLPKAARERGLKTLYGAAVTKVFGKRGVEAVEVSELRASGRPTVLEKLDCDGVAVSGGWNPVVHLWSHSGGKLTWDEDQVMFRPDRGKPPLGPDGGPGVMAAGTANGCLDLPSVVRDAAAAGQAAAEALGRAGAGGPPPEAAAAREDRVEALWFTPAQGKDSIGSKHFLDYQNDVTAADVELAAREGYESVEHTKRYTTLGMATDQGKVSNVNGLAILADTLRKPIPAVGTTTFRPPYTPISFGSIAGREKGKLFKPVRETPMHAWHQANGADWEPVGDWRRPYCYRRMTAGGGRETTAEAVNREILTVRRQVGLLDASTLGKIIVQGPDAGAFLDLLYTNMMSTLKPGRCRYGLMCNDNGYLFDDGVVVRLDDGARQLGGAAEQSYLCHTTSGGADRVHAWMEELLQTEWPHLRVYTQNATEAYAQIAVAGPKAREVLSALDPTLDLSDAALPFMAWAAGTLAGMPARVYRISFSGELSFEVATPAHFGRPLWDALHAAGAAHGVAAYGTEALHVMRAEKGFIMIGDETDGTVAPRDLGLGWAVSKKKTDFIGKRGMERPFFTDPQRKRLVGLLTEDPTEVLPSGAPALAAGEGGAPKIDGHVTSSYWSPTLGRSIAMALIRGGPDRMGQTVEISTGRDVRVRATITEPTFYEPPAA